MRQPAHTLVKLEEEASVNDHDRWRPCAILFWRFNPHRRQPRTLAENGEADIAPRQVQQRGLCEAGQASKPGIRAMSDAAGKMQLDQARQAVHVTKADVMKVDAVD